MRLLHCGIHRYGAADNPVYIKFFVFDSKKSYKTKQEIIKFVLVNCWGMFQVYILSTLMRILLINFDLDIFWSENISHLLAVGSLAITSCILHSYFTFRK